MYAFQMKLKSDRGASMLLALVFLFFALSVGAVVLTAATVSAGRLTRVQKQEQQYLAVQSAARLIKDELTGFAFLGQYTSSQTTTYDADGVSSPGSVVTSSGAGTLTAPSYIENLLENDYTALYRQKSGLSTAGFAETPRKMELTLPDLADPTFPAVTVQLTVKKDYTLEIILTHVITQADSSKKQFNTMTMLYRPIVLQNETTDYTTAVDGSSSTSTTTYTTDVTYSAPTITKGGATIS